LFGRNAYINLIARITDAGLSPSTNWAGELGENDFFLRHDVDFSVSAALSIAKIEHSLGLQSTFFFLLSSNLYNLLSKTNSDQVREIRDLGHKISLHWDSTAHRDEQAFLTEKQAFEEVFEVTIDIVSAHRPAEFLRDNDRNLFGVPHTYQNRFFKEISYISDSAGTPVQTKVEHYLDSRNQNGLQLLLHPIWWINETDSPTTTLNHWLLENTDFVRNQIRANCKAYNS